MWLVFSFVVPSVLLAAAALVYRVEIKRTWRIVKRDVTGVSRFLRVKRALRKSLAEDWTIGEAFRRTVQKHEDKVMIFDRNVSYTFKEANEFTNRIAQIFLKRGYKPGDTVVLCMENNPEYILMWIGLSKIGVVTALVNTNLKPSEMSHSFKIAVTKAVIFSSALEENVSETLKVLGSDSQVKDLFRFGGENGVISEAQDLRKLMTTVLPDEPTYKGKSTDKVMYIYTSGTTGFPKAAIINHRRYIAVALSTFHMMPLKTSDIIYIYLPLYHTAATMLGAGPTIFFGISAAVATKFSATRFWTDCVEYKCTITQYIGEICRYLLATPSRPEEKMHSIRLVYGNGLRLQIWDEFKNRFGINEIRELYGSTEGTSSSLNIDNTPGSIGFLPAITWWVPCIGRRIVPHRIVKINPDTGEVLRDVNEFCIECKPFEEGQMISRLNDADPMQMFEGYSDPKASEKKILTHVFTKGDRYFSSGDVLMMDSMGYLYFKDRTGDTFRWKGENCSTAAIEDVLQKVSKLGDVAVFGVEVPHTEGKAGMAVINDVDNKLDLDEFLKQCRNSLPSYSIPLFLRLTQQMELTGTFKLIKTNYSKHGFNISCFSDPVYFLSPREKKYVRLTPELYGSIIDGQLRL